MRFSPKPVFYAGLFCALTVATSAQAITFDFNSLDNGASNHDIENYMDGVLESAGYDRGTLSDVSGAVGSNRYSADNHIVGPKSGWSVTSLTLGNTDHCANADSTCSPNSSRDTFLMNNTSYSDRITLSFSGAGLKLDSISFDLEIFPNGSCSSEWNCGRNKSNWPDFTLYINGNPVKIWDAVEPGDSGTYENSPDDKYGETAPQLLTESGELDLGGLAVTSIEFVDWPAAIGIDNLTLVEAQTPPQGNTSPVPAPPALSLFVLGLGGLGVMRRRRAA